LNRRGLDFEPVLVRVAGLPNSALEPFASTLCARELADHVRCAAALAAARAEAADRLHAAVPEAPAHLRRFLLALRRDCFNGRALRGWKAGEEWHGLRALVGDSCDRVVALEERLAAAQSALEIAYDHQRERERSHLGDLLADRRLRRGIALASPVALENAHRLSRTPARSYGRKDLRLESTLLRYVSRAAFKLSPFSTFTPLALGALRQEARTVRLLGTGGTESSLLRLKRYLLDQSWELLQTCPAVRETLEVALNNSIEEVSPGRYRFVRPSHWALDPERQAYSYFLPAVVTAGIGGPLAAWLRSQVPARRPTYLDLVAALGAEHALSAPAGRAHVEQLLRIGFLRLLPPWPVHEAHLERAMAELTRRWSADASLAPLADVLDRIVALERDFPSADAPEHTVVELERLLDELWAASAALGGIEPGTTHARLRTGNCYEDVFLVAAPAAPQPETVQIPREAVQGALSSVDPLVRVLGLFSHRHELLHTLEAFMAQRWPDRTEIGALELFAAFQSLWAGYMRYLREARGPARASARFNPLELAEIEELSRLRQAVRSALASLIEPADEGSRIDVLKLAPLARELPERYAPRLGPCPFLQPADAAGSLWILNRLNEGTGRYGSRFTAVMPEAMRRGYTAHLAERGADARGAELLDLMCPQGDTLNVHAVQTRYALQMPGEVVDLPAARKVSLGELRVRRGSPGDSLRVVDASGRPYLPVHLGGAAFDYLPTPLKMLFLLGPGEMRFGGLPREDQRDGDMTSWNRLTLGNVVLLRKRWYIPTPALAGQVAGASDPAAFAAINRWRLERRLPDRVVFIEKIHHESGEERYKPQYLDFTSPSFVALFRAALKENAASLTFEEMLPLPESAPRDPQGQGWAVELMLDTLALDPPNRKAAESPAPPSTAWAAGPELQLQHGVAH
jgi:hypothetical protein